MAICLVIVEEGRNEDAEIEIRLRPEAFNKSPTSSGDGVAADAAVR